MVDYSTVLLEGPWIHRFVAANGARFHVAEAGPEDAEGPLVLLLHGFPQFWWAWRHQLAALGAAGRRVAAVDLRGFGASDKPPTGNDLPTHAADVAALVGSLGAERAVVVGSGMGALVAWSLPYLHPDSVQAIGALGMPHPARLRGRLRRMVHPGALRHLTGMRLPVVPVRSLARGHLAPQLLREWGSTGWLGEEAADLYLQAMRIPSAAHSATEQMRWLVAANHARHGRRLVARLRSPLPVPALQLHGSQDGCMKIDRARDDGRWAGRRYRFAMIRGAGHFPAEEAPGHVTEILTEWLEELDREG